MLYALPDVTPRSGISSGAFNRGTKHNRRLVDGAFEGVAVKNLLTMTAVCEVGIGLVLVALPSPLAMFLLGSALDTPVASTVARVTGVALLALGVACWLARRDGQSPAATGLAGALVLYNAGIVAVLVYAGLALGLSSIGLWPTVLLHAAMTGWCVTSLLRRHPWTAFGRRNASSK